MCLILFACQQHEDYPLIVIANRDEYYARATRNAHWWDDEAIFAGRDLEAGGTWLGIHRNGRFAAVTNVREPGSMRGGKKSRGELTRVFLSGDYDAETYLEQLAPQDQDYAGFNLLLGDADGLWFYSNRDHGLRRIEPGIYGISNGAFDEPWPKLSTGKAELEEIIRRDEPSLPGLLDILTDHRIDDDVQLPNTGVSLDIERMLSSRFIRSTEYGTLACTVLMVSRQGRVNFYEKNFIDAEHDGELIQTAFEIST